MQNTTIRTSLIMITTLIVVAILILSNFGESRHTKVYDCREAHWHPDYPVEVKQQCREIMEEYYRDWRNIPHKNLTTT